MSLSITADIFQSKLIFQQFEKFEQYSDRVAGLVGEEFGVFSEEGLLEIVNFENSILACDHCSDELEG